MNYALILNFVVIILLIATIIYSTILNRKVASLYQHRGELQHFLASFTSSLAKAEQSMQVLKGTGETAFAMVEQHMKQAAALRDDLSFLVERGEAIAARLDDNIREARTLNKDLEGNVKQFDRSSAVKSPVSNPVEPELIQALRNVR